MDEGTLDSDWLRIHPLPLPAIDASKNDRGRVLVIGGSRTVPGGIALTAEAALRAGAGKVQLATIESAALPLGISMPEIAVFPLVESDEGDLLADAAALERLLNSCDAVVAGPAMIQRDAADRLLDALLTLADEAANPPVLILDAAVLQVLPAFADRLKASPSVIILTPHAGELQSMLECDEETAKCTSAARDAAAKFGAIVLQKGPISVIVDDHGTLLKYAGGGTGLATGGSGDVLAGIVAGLVSRGAAPVEATAWATWLHGEAGRRRAEQSGPLGYLSRELLAEIPALMRGY